jgi:type IX secretion system substrate protein
VTTYTYGGGGGGGGYYGGGSGYSSNSTTYYSSGGGGGSSYLGSMATTTNIPGATDPSGSGIQAPGSGTTGYVTGTGNGGNNSGTSGGSGLVLITYTLPGCTTPVSPTSLGLTSAPGNITGTFSPASSVTGYLVIRTTGSAPAVPTNGTSYTPGATALGGYIVSTNTATGFSDATVAPSGPYSYYVYSYNNPPCAGGPVYSVTTISGSTTSAACAIQSNNLTVTAGTIVNWSTASWSQTHAPYPCENVTITFTPSTNTGAQTAIINLDVTGVTTVASLTMTGNYTSSTTGAKTLTLAVGANSLVIAGNLNITATGGNANPANYAALTAGTGGTVTVNGNATIGGTADTKYSIIGSSQSITGAGTTTPTFIFLGNLTFNQAASTGFSGDPYTKFIFDGGTSQTFTNNVIGTYWPRLLLPNTQIGLNFTPTLTIAGTSTTSVLPIYVYQGNLTVSNGATLVVPNNYDLNQYTAGDGIFTLSGTGTVNYGGITTSAANAVAGSNFSGGFATYNFNTASTVVYNGAVTQTVYSAPAYGNLTIANTASTTATAGGALTINGSVLINSGSAFAGSTFAHTVAGNWTNNGTYTAGTSTNSTVTFNGISAQTIGSTNNISTAFNNLSITNTTASGVSLGIVTTVSNNFALASNSTFNDGGFQLTGNATGTFTAAAGSFLNIGLPTSINNTTFPSTFIKANITLNATSTTSYQANASQTISAVPAYGNLNIGNSTSTPSTNTSSGGNITVAGAMNVFTNATGDFSAGANTNTVTGLTTITGNYKCGTGTQTLTGGLTVAGGVFTGSSGAVTTSGVILSNGTLTAPSGTFSVSGNWAQTGGTFSPGTNTVTFTAATGITQTLNSGGSSFYNISHTGAGTLQLLTNALSAGGALTNSAGSFDAAANSLACTVTGLTTVSGGTYLAGSATQNLTGGLTISGGTFTGSTGAVSTGAVILSTGALTAPSGAFSVAGNWAKTGGTFTPGTNTVTFTAASGTQTLNSGGTSFYSISHTGAGTLQLLTNALTATGTFGNSAGTFDAVTNNFAVTVTGLTTVNGGSYLAAATATQNLNGGLTVSGGTFTGSATSGIVNTSDVVLSSGTINAPASTGLGGFNVSGNWNNNGGTFNANGGKVTFTGSNPQTIGSTNGTSTTFYNLIDNSSNAVTGVSLGVATTVSNNFSILGGNIFNDGGYQLTGNVTGKLTAAAGSFLNIGSPTSTNITSFPSAFITANITLNATSTTCYQANAAQTVSALPVYGILNIGNAAITPATNASAGGNITVAGAMNVFAGATHDISANGYTNTVTGLTTINGTYLCGTGLQTLSGGLTLTGSGAQFTGSTGTVTTSNVILNGGTLVSPSDLQTGFFVSGNWTNNGGTFNPNNSSVLFNGGGAQSIIGGTGVTSQTFYTIATVLNGTALTVSGATTSLYVTNMQMGTKTQTSTTFAPGTATNIYVAFNWVDNGALATGSFLPGTNNTVTFNGGSPQKINSNFGNVTSPTFYNLSTANSGTILIIANASAITSLNINGSLNIGLGSTFNPGNNFSGNTSVIKGDWTNNGLFTTSGETFSFAGGGTQNINGNISTVFTGIDVSNSSNVLLGLATSATRLNFTSGYIDASKYNLTLSGPNVTGTPSNSSFVITGQGTAAGSLIVKKITTTGFTFPIGVDTSGNHHYLPATVKPTTAGLTWSANVFPYVTANGVYPVKVGGVYNNYSGAALSGIVNAVWTIAPVPPTSPGNTALTLGWTDNALEGTSFRTYVPCYIGISHNSGVWDIAKADAGSACTGHAYSVTYSLFNSFSPFGVGAVGDPLVISLIDFNAELNSNKTVGLTWTTQQELNSSHFEIERSADETNWITLGTVTAKGNNASASDYGYTDESPLSGINYYRLKTVNLDGSYSYTNIKTIRTIQVKGIVIFPNPARNYVNVSINQSAVDLNVKLVNSLGQVMQVMQVKAGTSITLTLDVHNYAQGTYILQVTGSDGTFQTSKVLIMR